MVCSPLQGDTAQGAQPPMQAHCTHRVIGVSSISGFVVSEEGRLSRGHSYQGGEEPKGGRLHNLAAAGAGIGLRTATIR